LRESIWFEARAQEGVRRLEHSARIEVFVGKVLVLIGLGIAALGVLMMFGLPFGRLPGDIMIRRGNFTFYFPLATSIVLSILLTLFFSLFNR
jgi:hypothetical protein